MNTRAKWAYLSYNSMLIKIQDGTLDAYDVVYCPDTRENYVISPDLEPWAVKSKVYIFNSIEEANIALNTNTDTYVGQIISILNNNTYKGYIVNKDENENYSATPLTNDNIDYNNLGNRPIENIVGDLDNVIIIKDLNNGYYKIKGQYKIFEDDETNYLSVDGDLFLIGTSNDSKYIKRITTDSIYDFIIKDDGVVKKIYITDDYLNDCGYSTTEYVDKKITALEEAIKDDIESYIEATVEAIVTEKVETIIDEQLDIKLDEKIKGATDEEVRNALINGN